MLTREAIISALSPLLHDQECIRAAWLGGSDATGRADELSDVDLGFIVSSGRTEEAAKAVEKAVESVSPIRLKFRMPWPTWHGFHQAFYQLEDAHEHTMIDWVIMESGQPHPWFEVERHGRPRVLFDKDRLIVEHHTDAASTAQVVARKVAELRIKFPMFAHLPVKLVERGQPVDASYFYQNLVLRQLVDLLRCIHCPLRHDYGFRYISSDLPTEAYKLLVELSYYATPNELLDRVHKARTAFERALSLWDSTHAANPAQQG